MINSSEDTTAVPGPRVSPAGTALFTSQPEKLKSMYGYRQAGGLTADLLLNTKLLSLGEPQQKQKKKKNAACSTRPTRGLFLGEGEYKIPHIWTSCLQRVELFHLQLQQLNSTNSGRNECTRFLTFKFWLCTNYHTGQSRKVILPFIWTVGTF